MSKPILKVAKISHDKKYRYHLVRVWDTDKNMVAFVGLNPSTADETKDDPTIKKCMTYAKDWGYGGILMLNLFAFRSTDASVLEKEIDPIGPEADRWINQTLENPLIKEVIVCWGNQIPNHLRRRAALVFSLIRGQGKKINCLRVNSNGSPAHPLYLPANAKRITWLPS